MFCPKCGAPLNGGAFCNQCGAPVEPQKPEKPRGGGGAPWLLMGGIVVLIVALVIMLLVRILWNRTPGIPEETTTESTAAPEAVADAEKRARELLAGMSREEQIYQLFVVLPEEITGAPLYADGTLAQALERRPVGGVLLEEGNLESREQSMELLTRLRAASKLPLLLGAAEEGTAPYCSVTGKEAMGLSLPETTGALGAGGSVSKTQGAYETLCGELGALGFNLNLAPVADVNSNPENPVMGDRSFGERPEQVANLVTAAVRGTEKAGLISCVKYFPGHGDVTLGEDGLYRSEKTLTDLKRCELLPFREAIQEGVPAVMVSADVFPAVDNRALPACLSPAMVNSLLREELGYEGVVLTAPLNSGALEKAYPGGEVAVMALEAGCDLLLLPEDLDAAAAAIGAALDAGRLSQARLEESVLRILRLKLEYGLMERENPGVSDLPGETDASGEAAEPAETISAVESERAPAAPETITAAPDTLSQEEIAALEAAVQENVNFLTSIYKQPREIDPNCVLHSGGPCHDVTQAEREALAAAHGEEYLTNDVVKFTAGELDPYFEARCGVPFRQLLIKPGKNTMPYLEDYDAYYIVRDMSQSFTLKAGYARRNEDGTYTLGYRNPKENNGDFEVTFRLENGKAIFLSNQRVS